METGPFMQDRTILGPGTRLRGVQGARIQNRPWIARFPVCPALNQHDIAHVGAMEAAAPFEIVRSHETSSTYFLAALEGEGQVWLDGGWRLCRSGQACLFPAHTLNAFRAVPGVRWSFVWVRFDAAVARATPRGGAPVIAKFDATPLRLAIQGLEWECERDDLPAAEQNWVDLVYHYFQTFAEPARRDDRLASLWDRVRGQLHEVWSLARLSRESGYSNEHLRRLCRAELGRSPMHQVTYLRMKRAAELLTRTAYKLETIASQVGYQNPFVFSNTFTKWVGWRPSEYRRKKAAAPAVIPVTEF